MVPGLGPLIISIAISTGVPRYVIVFAICAIGAIGFGYFGGEFEKASDWIKFGAGAVVVTAIIAWIDRR